MYTEAEVDRMLERVGLKRGLGRSDLLASLTRFLQLGECGWRGVAFYLEDMDARGLHDVTGHRSTPKFAEDRLGLSRRRARELIQVGRMLRKHTAIDAAFCKREIGWSQVVLLMRVISSEHETAWLEHAKSCTVRKLRLDVQLARKGGPPRKDDNQKGLPEVRFPVRAKLDVLGQRTWDEAKQKLGAERGGKVDDAELMRTLAGMFLNLEVDGTVEGYKHVPASLYRIVVHELPGDEAERRSVDTDLGRLPLPRAESECIRCDSDCMHTDGTKHKDRTTPPAMRKAVQARDGHRCTCCGSKHGLMVHHIRWRSEGGATEPYNLITVCRRCHTLIHAELLVLVGTHAEAIRFVDAEGNALGEPGACAVSDLLRALEPSEPEPEPVPEVTLDDVPGSFDGAWWRSHMHLVRVRGDQGLSFQAGIPREPEESEAAPRPEPEPASEAFAGIVGQDALLTRFEKEALVERKLGRAFPHTLLTGPAGTGKSTLARGIARLTGRRLEETSGPLLRDPLAIVRLLASLREGDALFVDEIHALPRRLMETLYQAVAERRVCISLHAGMRERTVELRLPDFTLLAATSEQAELPDALRSRFGLWETLGHYTTRDLGEMAAQHARERDFTLVNGASELLAEHARGTPREIRRLVERAITEGVWVGTRELDSGLVRRALTGLGYDERGLRPAEQAYLNVVDEARGAAMPLARIASGLGVTPQAVLRDYEPHLVRRGYIQVRSCGRLPGRLLAGAQGAADVRRPADPPLRKVGGRPPA